MKREGALALLEKIASPADIRRLNESELDTLAEEVRINKEGAVPRCVDINKVQLILRHTELEAFTDTHRNHPFLTLHSSALVAGLYRRARRSCA